jgi:hypothetical protein
MPEQDKARAAIGALGGDYALPRQDSMKEMNSPEFIAMAQIAQGNRQHRRRREFLLQAPVTTPIFSAAR